MYNAFNKTFFPLETDVLISNNSLLITSQAGFQTNKLTIPLPASFNDVSVSDFFITGV